MTMVEMLVATGIGGIVLAAVASMSFYTARSVATMANYDELDRQSQNTLDNMSYRIRSASRLISYSTNQITFSYNGGTLSYTYSPLTKKLTQNLNGVTRTMLEDCTALRFHVFQRSVVSNSFNQYVANGTNDAKVVLMEWTCSKTVMGKATTEAGQSARIILRNNP